eukprot:g41142.t1
MFLQQALFFLFVRVLNAEEATEAKLSPSKIKALGDEALSKGKYDEAVKQYTALIAVEPTAKHYYKRAAVYLRQRKYSQALPDLDQAAALDPTYTVVYGHRARAHLSKGNCAEALQDYQLVLKEKPTDKKAMEGAEKARRCIPLLAQVDNYVKGGRWSQAKTTLNSLLEISPESIDFLLKQCNCDSQLRDYDSVILNTRQLLKLDKMNLDALELRAKAYFYTLEHEAAMNHVKEGLRLDMESKAFKALRTLFRKVDKAKVAGEQAMEQSQWQTAVDSFKEAMEASPEHTQLQHKLNLQLCKAYVQLKKFDVGLEACNKVLAVENKNEAALMNRAELYIIKGNEVSINTLYYTILYYIILYYTILYYTILYYTILYYTILYYTILYYTIYYTILYYTILCCAMLCYAILYYTILYYTILYYTILYYTILYYTILYYTILYYTILYYTILYYTILYYTILYYILKGNEAEEGRDKEAWYNKANQDFNAVLQENQQHSEARQGAQRVAALIKRAKQKDYYKILSLKSDCTDREIKKAFRQLALIWHPDKHEAEEDKAEAEAKFREIAEAHEVLSDPETRGKYDRGEDLEEKTQQFRNQGFPFQGGFPFGGGGHQHFKFHFGG